MSLDLAQGQQALQEQLHMIAIRHMAASARESCPRGDIEAATSAFLSEVAVSEYAHYFPWLEPET